MKLGKLVITGLAAAGLVGLGLFAPVPSSVGQEGKTWTVCLQGCDFQRIQEAIDAAAHGDTILIQSPGIYHENLTITKSLKIAPYLAFPVIIQPKAAFVGPVITVNGEGAIQVTLEGLIVQGLALEQAVAVKIIGQASVSLDNIEVGPSVGFGLIVRDQARVTIRDSRFHDNISGLEVEDSVQATVINSVFFNNRVKGIGLGQEGQLHLIGSTIFGTKLDGTGIGIDANDMSKVVIERSLIYDNRLEGVQASESSTVEISNSIIAWNNRSGILLLDQPTLIVKESIIYSNDPWGIAAWLPKCGFDRNWYSGGTVQIDQATVFVKNGKGDVCLP